MDGVSCNNVSHPSSHGPASDVGNILCSHLGFAPHLLVFYVNEIANVLCNECNGSEHVSVHNYFIRIVYVIKSSSSKLLMPRFCSSMQIPSCFVPTPI